jgi:hypothetical protein
MGLSFRLLWFIYSGQSYAVRICALPSHDRGSVTLDLRFFVLVWTFQARKVSIVLEMVKAVCALAAVDLVWYPLSRLGP